MCARTCDVQLSVLVTHLQEMLDSEWLLAQGSGGVGVRSEAGVAVCGAEWLLVVGVVVGVPWLLVGLLVCRRVVVGAGVPPNSGRCAAKVRPAYRRSGAGVAIVPPESCRCGEVGPGVGR